jgi:hypothetical protein
MARATAHRGSVTQTPSIPASPSARRATRSAVLGESTAAGMVDALRRFGRAGVVRSAGFDRVNAMLGTKFRRHLSAIGSDMLTRGLRPRRRGGSSKPTRTCCHALAMPSPTRATTPGYVSRRDIRTVRGCIPLRIDTTESITSDDAQEPATSPHQQGKARRDDRANDGRLQRVGADLSMTTIILSLTTHG